MTDLSTCTICKLEFKNVLKKKIHEQQVHVFIFQCDICQTKYKTLQDLEIHKDKNHKTTDEQVSCTETIQEVIAVECSSCEELFKSEIELREHETKEHFPTVIAVECETCEELFKSEEDLDNHTTREHPPTIEAIECAHCDELFKNEKELEEHDKSEHNSRGEETNIKNDDKGESTFTTEGFEDGDDEKRLNESTKEVFSNKIMNEKEATEPREPELVEQANKKSYDIEKVTTEKENHRFRKENALKKKKKGKERSFNIEKNRKDETSNFKQREMLRKKRNDHVEDQSLADRKKELKKKKRKMAVSNLNSEKKRKLDISDHSKEEKMMKCTQHDLDELAFKAIQIDNIRKHEQILISKLDYLKAFTRKIPVNDEDVTLEIGTSDRDDYIDDQDVEDVLDNLPVTPGDTDQHSLKIEPEEVTPTAMASPICQMTMVSFAGDEVPQIKEISELIEDEKGEVDKLVINEQDQVSDDGGIHIDEKTVSQDEENVGMPVVKTKEFKKRKVKEMEKEHKKLRKRLEELQKKKMKKGRTEEFPIIGKTSVPPQEALADKIDDLEADQEQDLDLKDPEDYIQQLQQLYKKKNQELSESTLASQASTVDDNAGEVKEIAIAEQSEGQAEQVSEEILSQSLNNLKEQKEDHILNDNPENDREVEEISEVGKESEYVLSDLKSSVSNDFDESMKNNDDSVFPSKSPHDGQIQEDITVLEKESEQVSSVSNTLEQKNEDEFVEDHDDPDIPSDNAFDHESSESGDTHDSSSIFSLTTEKNIPDSDSSHITQEDGLVNNEHITNHLPMDLDLSDSDSDSETKSISSSSGNFGRINEAPKQSDPKFDVDEPEFLTDQPACSEIPEQSSSFSSNKGFSIFDIGEDEESLELPLPSQNIFDNSIHENNSLDLLNAVPTPDQSMPVQVSSDINREPKIEHKAKENKSKTIIEIEPMPIVTRPKKRGRPKKIKVGQEEILATLPKEIVPKKRGRPKKAKESGDLISRTEATTELNINEELKPKTRGRGRPRKNKDEDITSRNKPSYLPTLLDGYAADVEDSNFTFKSKINQDDTQMSGEAFDMEVESSVAELQKELSPLVDDFNSLLDVESMVGINLYPAEPDGTPSNVDQPYIRDWTPVKGEKSGPSPVVVNELHINRKEEDKVDLGFLQVLSDSDEDDSDANDNLMQDAGFMALLSDSETEDETNNNENIMPAIKNLKEWKEPFSEGQEVMVTGSPIPVPEDNPDTITEPMHTLFKAKYDVLEDTRRPYNKWITDVSVGAGWKMKRKGKGIIYKDKKGSIFKSRFRALKHYISSQNSKPTLIKI